MTAEERQYLDLWLTNQPIGAASRGIVHRLLAEHDALEEKWYASNRAIAELEKERDALAAEVERLRAPIPMILHCPTCHTQHVDAPEPSNPGWRNPPHRTHLCHGCGRTWRPAHVATNGVAELPPKEPSHG